MYKKLSNKLKVSFFVYHTCLSYSIVSTRFYLIRKQGNLFKHVYYLLISLYSCRYYMSLLASLSCLFHHVTPNNLPPSFTTLILFIYSFRHVPTQYEWHSILASIVNSNLIVFHNHFIHARQQFPLYE
jgi:hypothetical protein